MLQVKLLMPREPADRLCAGCIRHGLVNPWGPHSVRLFHAVIRRADSRAGKMRIYARKSNAARSSRAVAALVVIAVAAMRVAREPALSRGLLYPRLVLMLATSAWDLVTPACRSCRTGTRAHGIGEVRHASSCVNLPLERQR